MGLRHNTYLAFLGIFLFLSTAFLLLFRSETNVLVPFSDDIKTGDRLKKTSFHRQVSLDESMRGVHHVHMRRRKTVQEVCARNKARLNTARLDPKEFQYLIVDDNHKLLYCMVPKVACTNWRRVMLVLSGKTNATDPMDLKANDVHETLSEHLPTLDMYTEEEIRYRLDNYYKFLFVRNPLERILSAYRNKFRTNYNTYFPKKYGKDIIKRFRKHPSKASLEKGNDVTFPEFVKYLLDPSTKRPFNAHWREYFKLCHPCITGYDAIGKYETLDEDADFILTQAGVADKVKFPHTPPQPQRPRTADLLAISYANISSEDIHRLWEIYSVDYAMFGYEYPHLEIPPSSIKL